MKLYDPLDDTIQFRLHNGLRVAVYNDPKINWVGMKLIIEVGAIDDPMGKSGMAHFLEHMQMEINGKTILEEEKHFVSLRSKLFTCRTGVFDTNVSCNAAKQFCTQALQYLFDTTLNMQIKDGFEKQQQIVLREYAEKHVSSSVNSHEKDLVNYIAQDVPHAVYSQILGMPETIRAITLEDLELFCKEYYSYANSILVLYGAITESEAKHLLSQVYMNSEKPALSLPPRNYFKFSNSDTRKHRTITKFIKDINPHLDEGKIDLLTFGNHSEHSYYAAALLERWLFATLREEQKLIYSIGTGAKVVGALQGSFYSLHSEKDNLTLKEIAHEIQCILDDPSSLRNLFEDMKEEFLLEYELKSYSFSRIMNEISHRMMKRMPQSRKDFSPSVEYEREAALTFEDILKIWHECFAFRSQITVFEK